MPELFPTLRLPCYTVLNSALADGFDAVELYSYNCMHFGRQYNAAFFLLSSSLWRRFHLSDWAKVVAGIQPRPEPLWAWDGGHFADISFLAGRLKIDAFEIGHRVAKIAADELRKVARYGAIHAELLLPESAEGFDESDEADEYEPILLSAVSEARSRLLNEAPLLDLSRTTASQLRDRLTTRFLGS